MLITADIPEGDPTDQASRNPLEIAGAASSIEDDHTVPILSDEIDGTVGYHHTIFIYPRSNEHLILRFRCCKGFTGERKTFRPGRVHDQCVAAERVSQGMVL
jgi:hypothetical protein